VNASNWAYLSNNLMYSTLVAYALAMLAFGLEFVAGIRSAPEPARVGSSTPASLGLTDQPKSTQPEATRPEATRPEATRWERQIGGIALALTYLAFLLHLGAVVSRGLSTGRVPWSNMYEFSTTGALAVTAAFLLLMKRLNLRWLAILVIPSILIALGTAVTLLYRPSAPLAPALQSPWLIIHVFAAIISGGVFLIANAVAATYLYLDHKESTFGRPKWAHRIPSLDALDQLSYRLVAFVFPLWTFSIIAGAIWAEAAWGRYWGWDPKETWAFITWVGYAAYLHARVTVGWRGRKAAWLCLIAGSTFLFNYVYVNVWGTGRHSYSGL
jgi:cytochrome c-type biogenesis protein CcsB